MPPPDTAMAMDRLEPAMFWVGALLAFLPVVILLSVLGWVQWQRRKNGESNVR